MSREQCSGCRFWDVYDDPGALKRGMLGDCRRRSPLICDAMLREFLPRGRDAIRECEVEHDLYIASAFPVTEKTSWCGEFAARGEELPIC